MKSGDLEAFIRAAAERNWSRRQTAAAIGVCRDKFDLMVQALPDVQWAAPGQTVLRRANLKTNAQAAAGRAKGRASQRAACLHTVGDRTATVPEFARELGINPSTLYRRMATMTLADALIAPKHKPVPPHLRKLEVSHAA